MAMVRMSNWETKSVVTKSSISKCFSELRSNGFTVIIFQSDKVKRTQERGMTDLMILDPRGILYFVEIKTKNDKVQESQKPLYNAVTNAKSGNIFYCFAEEHNFRDIRNAILQRDFKALEKLTASDKITKQTESPKEQAGAGTTKGKKKEPVIRTDKPRELKRIRTKNMNDEIDSVMQQAIKRKLKQQEKDKSKSKKES